MVAAPERSVRKEEPVQITEVRIKLMEDSDDRLQAFCSITFDDCFVVRDLKIIEGANGPFVAMPSRKLTAHCSHCGTKNHLRSLYCNQCGHRLKEAPVARDQDGRAKLYADIAHPINSQCRELIQNRVIEEFRLEQERATEPGYVSRYDEAYGDEDIVATALPESREVPTRSGEYRQIQPGTSEPRGPHRMPAAQPAAESAPPPAATERKKNGGFGAGIF